MRHEMEHSYEPISEASKNSRDPCGIHREEPKSGGRGELEKEMRSPVGSRMGQNPLVNASRGANVGSDKDSHGCCLFCLKELKRYRASQRFCGARCRLLFWAAGEIVREGAAGNAEGIRALIERLK